MTDLFERDAKAERDSALARVRENAGEWRDLALAAFVLIPGFEGTGEDIRIRLTMKGLSEAHHHNAWGEVINAAIRKKLIVPTGQMRHMKTAKSHARRTPVYRVRDGF